MDFPLDFAVTVAACLIGIGYLVAKPPYWIRKAVLIDDSSN